MEWIKLTKKVYNKYKDQKVIVIDVENAVVIGNLFESTQYDNRINCEDDNVFITDVQYIIPVTQIIEELRTLLPK